MSSRSASQRRAGRPVVAVTGAATGIGWDLAAQLVAGDAARKVVAIDERRGDIPGAVWKIADIRDPILVRAFAGVDVVAHLAVDMSLETQPRARAARNIHQAQTVLTAAAAAGVRQVVLYTSAMVYGAAPDNTVPLSEDAPLRAVPETSVVGDLLEIEQLARQARTTYPGLSVTVVRPAALVGPGVDSVLTRHFEAPRLLVVRDSRPHWQFCHVEDLVRALEYVVLGKLEGATAVTVGCDGWLEQAEVERLSGMRRIELPVGLAFGAAERLHRLGLTPAPASDLAYVAYPWVIPATRLRAAGWAPLYSNQEILVKLLEQTRGHHAALSRRLGRKDATLGATVALIGTAALVRRARRKRRHQS